MAVIDPPLFLQGDSHPARSVRALIAEMYDEGVMDLTALRVTQRASGGANYSVDVAAGRCVIAGDNTPIWQGNYMGINDAVVNLVPTSVPTAGNTRIDSVCFQVRDTSEDGGGTNDARLYIKAGTQTTGTPAAPTLDNNAIRLANILLTNSTTSIVNAALTDQRLLAGRKDTPGVMVALGWPTIPNGWLLCDGSAVSRTTYARLFSHIGTSYGSGDGSTTYNLPNLLGRIPVPVHSGGNIAVDNVGETGGWYTHTLTTSELPSHAHTINHDHGSVSTDSQGAHTHSTFFTGESGDPSGALGDIAVPSSPGGNTSSNGAHTHSVDLPNFSGSSGNQGGGAEHNNMPPYQVVGCYIIRS